MRVRHKNDQCLNCQAPLTQLENYCPHCGQENTHYHLSLKDLIKDAFANYFNIDSQLIRTFIPLIIKPGHLTLAYIEGRRKEYMHPVRFYLILSLFFFFFFAKSIELDALKFNPIVNKTTNNQNGLNVNFNYGGQQNDKTGKLPNSLENTVDSTQRDPVPQKKELIKMSFFGTNLHVDDDKIMEWLKNPDMTSGALLDSLQVSEKTPFNLHVAGQVLKIMKNDTKILVDEMIRNIPIMMFILIPVLALLLKLAYIRSQKLYIEHLIFAFHWHTFLFCIFGILLALQYLFGLPEAFGLLILVIYLVYTYIAFKQVYQQGWFKTLVKINLVLLSFGLVNSFASALEILVSFLIV
jgi:Protein of unknown function (DUF3667)